MKTAQKLALAGLMFMSSSAYSQWSAGIISLGQTNPYIGGKTGIEVFPIVAYEGEKLVWRGPFLDYYMIGGTRSDTSLSIGLALAANDFDTDSDPKLVGINDRDSSFMAGFTFNQAWWTGTLSISIKTDVSDKHNGQRAVLGWQKPILKDKDFKWQVSAGVELEYLSDKYADYYYGVSSAEAENSVFSAFEVGAVMQPKLTLAGYYSFNKQWNLIGNLGLQRLDDEISDSPIVDSSNVLDGFVGVIYNF